MHVMRVLGTGHKEHVYHMALITALNKQRIAHRSEVICPILFMGQVVGFGKADLVIDDLVLELKATTKAPTSASGQLQKYLESMCSSERRAFNGMVINFNQSTGDVDIFTKSCPAPPPRRRVVTSSVFQRSLRGSPYARLAAGPVQTEGGRAMQAEM